MNINEICSKENIFKVINDKKLLNEAITQTRGFILYEMEKYNVYPDVDVLLENENVFSFNFILKNYDLEKAQIKKLKKYFYNNDKNQLSHETLTQEEIEEYLIEGKDLYHNTILSLDTLIKFEKEIIKIHDKERYSIKNILENSIKLLSPEQFLTLSNRLLSREPDLFKSSEDFFKDKKVKERFKALIKKGNPSNPLNYFEGYPFDLSEKEYFIQLLDKYYENENQSIFAISRYSELLKYHRAEDFISKIEFIERYNIVNIKDFSPAETEQYQERIKQVYFNDERPCFAHLVKSVNGITQLKEVVTLDFLREYIHLPEFDRYGSHTDIAREDREKEEYLYEVLTSLMEKEEVPLSEQSLDDVFGYIVKKSNKEDISQRNINIIFSILEKGLSDNKEVASKINFKYANQKKYIDYLIEKEPNLFKEWMGRNPNVNLLAMLLGTWEEKSQDDSRENKLKAEKMKPFINELVLSLPVNDVKALAHYYNYSLPSFNMLLNKITNNHTLYSSNNNFLNIDNKEIANIDYSYLEKLVYLKKEVRDTILVNKIKLPIHLMKNIIDSIGEKDSNKELIKFIQQYIENDREIWLNHDDVFSTILKNNAAKILFNIDTQQADEKNYQFLLKLLPQYQELQEKREAFMLKYQHIKIAEYYDEEYEFSEEEGLFFDGRREFEEEIEQHQQTIRLQENKISAQFLDEAIQQLFKEKKFNELLCLKNTSRLYGNTKLNKYLENLSFNELLKDIENKDFRDLLIDSSSHKESDIRLNSYTAKENNIIAQLLFPYQDNPKGLLCLFPHDNIEHLTDFIITNLPHQLIYDYEFRIGGNYIKKVLSVDDMIKTFIAVEKKEGFYCPKDVNSRINSFLNEHIKNDKNKLLELMKKAEDYPKLYIALCNFSVLEPIASKEFQVGDKRDRTTLDERTNQLFNQHVNIDILIKGMEIIKNEIIEINQLNHYDKAALKHKLLNALENITSTTYYDKEKEGSYEKERKSELSEEKSHQLLNAYWDICPSFITSEYQIGCISLKEKNEELYYHLLNRNEYTPLELLYPTQGFQSEYYNTDKNEETKKSVHNYVEQIMHYYVNKEKSMEIFFMDYLIQQYDFFEKELSGYYPAPGNTTIISYINKNEELKQKLNVTSRRFFLEQTLLTNDNEERKTNKI